MSLRRHANLTTQRLVSGPAPERRRRMTRWSARGRIRIAIMLAASSFAATDLQPQATPGAARSPGNRIGPPRYTGSTRASRHLAPHRVVSTIRVLFIGNSYTYVNNLPDLVRGMAAKMRARLTSRPARSRRAGRPCGSIRTAARRSKRFANHAGTTSCSRSRARSARSWCRPGSRGSGRWPNEAIFPCTWRTPVTPRRWDPLRRSETALCSLLCALSSQVNDLGRSTVTISS